MTNIERNDQICALRRRNWRPAEIAARLGLSRNVVAGVLHRANLCDSNSPKARGRGDEYTLGFKRQVVALARKVGVEAASRAYDVPASSVRDWRLGRAA